MRRSIASRARRLISTEALATEWGQFPPIVKPVRWYVGSLNCRMRPTFARVADAAAARESSKGLFRPSEMYTTAQQHASSWEVGRTVVVIGATEAMVGTRATLVDALIAEASLDLCNRSMLCLGWGCEAASLKKMKS